MSDLPPITFTREAFYEKVWTIPATAIAKELGVSDVLIGKICRQYEIPKPAPGYWSKLRHGKATPRTALPLLDDPARYEITINNHAVAKQPAPTPPVYDKDIQKLLDKAQRLTPIHVAEHLRKPHPLVAATREQLKIERLPFIDRPVNRERLPTLSAELSEEMTSRGLRILDALIKRIEKLGGHIEIGEDRRRRSSKQTQVHLANELVTEIRLREKLNQVRNTKKNKSLLDRDINLVPSGRLILDTGPGNSILLSDTESGYQIEQGLNSLVIGFIREAGEIRIKRREEEAKAKALEEQRRVRLKKEAELQQRRAELAEKQKVEKRRVEELMTQASSWKQSEILREFLKAVETKFKAIDSADNQDELQSYLDWAYQQADRLDPLKPSPPSILDDAIDEDNQQRTVLMPAYTD